MDKKSAEDIVCEAIEAIREILSDSGYYACVRLKSNGILWNRRVIDSLSFVQVSFEKRLFSYRFFVKTNKNNLVVIKTLTKSIHDVHTVKMTIQQMYANPDFSLFLPPYRKVSTIDDISVAGIVADFFTAVDNYFAYSGDAFSNEKIKVIIRAFRK